MLFATSGASCGSAVCVCAGRAGPVRVHAGSDRREAPPWPQHAGRAKRRSKAELFIGCGFRYAAYTTRAPIPDLRLVSIADSFVPVPRAKDPARQRSRPAARMCDGEV
jgi:hypothetical protein